MGAINAIGEIARGIGDTDGRLSHKIRLSDSRHMGKRVIPGGGVCDIEVRVLLIASVVAVVFVYVIH